MRIIVTIFCQLWHVDIYSSLSHPRTYTFTSSPFYCPTNPDPYFPLKLTYIFLRAFTNLQTLSIYSQTTEKKIIKSKIPMSFNRVCMKKKKYIYKNDNNNSGKFSITLKRKKNMWRKNYRACVYNLLYHTSMNEKNRHWILSCQCWGEKLGRPFTIYQTYKIQSNKKIQWK